MAIYYEGSFHTRKHHGDNRVALVRNVNYLVARIFHQVRENPDLVTVDGYGSIYFDAISVRDKYPNPFLPEEDWHENNYTSFDTVISFLLHELSRFGHMYKGEVRVDAEDRLWKLVIHDSKVFHVDGAWKIVYDENNAYQVGGVRL